MWRITYNIIMDEVLKEVVGKRLKESRKAAGLTQKAVANILNMTQQQYSRFENGIFELNYEQLKLICELYDISCDYLLGIKPY